MRSMRNSHRGRDGNSRDSDGGEEDRERPLGRTISVAVAMAAAAIATLVCAAAGCGGGSNSEVKQNAGTGGAPDGGGTAGTTGAGGTTGGGAGGQASGTGGATASGGATGTAGATGAGGSGGTAGGCPALTSYSQAEHIIMNVTWPNTLGTSGGTGQVHVWAKTTFTASGNNLMATSQACGSVLPPTGLNAIAGGGSVLIQIPDATWDLPSMPRFQFSATQTGWNTGSMISYTSTAPIGVTLTDPTNGAWPGTITTAVDADADMSPGYTALPAAGHVLPPTSLNAAANRADRVDIATRNVFMVTATRDACDHAKGPVTVAHFDSHVVGCHVSGGSDCTTAQANFVDQNRTIYQAGTSTIELKVVPASATCADVRTALPMM